MKKRKPAIEKHLWQVSIKPILILVRMGIVSITSRIKAKNSVKIYVLLGGENYVNENIYFVLHFDVY